MRLQALYAQVPDIPACRGLCSDSCGPIALTTAIHEVERIERVSSRELSCGAGASCSMLTADRRCSVYEDRPMICRLWGAVENMKCPYGCVPEGGWLGADEGLALLVEALEEGGLQPWQRDIARDEVKALFNDPQVRKKLLMAAEIVGSKPTIHGRNVPATVIERRYRG